HEGGQCWCKEGRRLCFPGGFQAGTGDAITHLLRLETEPFRLFFTRKFARHDVEQERRNSGVCQVGGNLGTHSSRAENGSFANPHHCFLLSLRLDSKSYA